MQAAATCIPPLVLNMWNQSFLYSLTQEREQHREHFLHQQKLLAVRSLVDNKPPRARRGPDAKRLNAQREWSSRVQKDNRLLLSRLLAIDMKTTGLQKQTAPRSGSVRSFHRSQESNRLASANRQYKQRLGKQHSYYNAKQWENDRSHTEYLRTQLSENSGHLSRSQRQNSPVGTAKKRRHHSTLAQLVEV